MRSVGGAPGRGLFLAACLVLLAASFPAHAWRAVGGGGRGVAVGPRGGAAAWGHGAGVARGPYGGAAAWNHGAGVARGPYGGAAAWNRGGAYYGGVRRPPVAYPVPVYRGGYYNHGYSGGEVAAAGVAGLAVGAMVGAAAASSANTATTTTTTTTVVAGQPSYSAPLPMGTRITVLPGGCASASVRDAQYYQCGPNWLKPYFGNASVYYQVVQAPY